MQHLRSMRPYFFILLIIIGVVLWKISSRPFNYAAQKPNAANTSKFIDLDSRTKAYNQELQTALDSVANDNEVRNTCFQYPRSDNESFSLWCGSTVLKTINVQPDAQHITALLKKIDPIVTEEHMKVSISAGTSISVDAIIYQAATVGPYEGPTCGVTILYFPNGNTPKALKDPDHIKYELYCSAPSSGSVPGYKYLKNPSDGSYSQAGPLAIP